MRRKIVIILIAACMLFAGACGRGQDTQTAEGCLKIAQHSLKGKLSYDAAIDLSGSLKTVMQNASGDRQETDRAASLTGHLKKMRNNTCAYAQGYITIQLEDGKPDTRTIEKYVDYTRGTLYVREPRSLRWYAEKDHYKLSAIDGTGFDLVNLLEGIQDTVSMSKSKGDIILTGKERGRGVITQVTLDETTGDLKEIKCTVDMPQEILSGITYQKGTIDVVFHETEGLEIEIPEEARDGDYMSDHDEKGSSPEESWEAESVVNK